MRHLSSKLPQRPEHDGKGKQGKHASLQASHEELGFWFWISSVGPQLELCSQPISTAMPRVVGKDHHLGKCPAFPKGKDHRLGKCFAFPPTLQVEEGSRGGDGELLGDGPPVAISGEVPVCCHVIQEECCQSWVVGLGFGAKRRS